jgi:hypothetical protein
MSVVIEGAKPKPKSGGGGAATGGAAAAAAEPNALISLRAKKESTLRQKLERSDKVEKAKGVELTT